MCTLTHIHTHTWEQSPDMNYIAVCAHYTSLYKARTLARWLLHCAQTYLDSRFSQALCQISACRVRVVTVREGQQRMNALALEKIKNPIWLALDIQIENHYFYCVVQRVHNAVRFAGTYTRTRTHMIAHVVFACRDRHTMPEHSRVTILLYACSFDVREMWWMCALICCLAGVKTVYSGVSAGSRVKWALSHSYQLCALHVANWFAPIIWRPHRKYASGDVCWNVQYVHFMILMICENQRSLFFL